MAGTPEEVLMIYVTCYAWYRFLSSFARMPVGTEGFDLPRQMSETYSNIADKDS